MNDIPNLDVVKALEPLTAVVREFVKTFDEEYDATLGPDFMANLDDMVVIYSIAIVDEGGKSFRDNFIKRFPECDCLSTFALSVFHEVGHLETEWDMDDDVELRNSDKMDDETYYNLHNEWIATEFAGEWATSHLEIAKQFDLRFTSVAKEIIGRLLD